MSSPALALRRTPLYDAHRELGARFVAFGGFEMPVQYGGVIREHDAVRTRAGLFDLSHMGQFVLRGAGVAEWSDGLTINHVATMKPWQARYNVFTNSSGGAHDDVIFYRLPADEWLLVVNASNAEKMWALLLERRVPGVELENRHGKSALVAIQGPRAVDLTLSLVAAPDERARIGALKYYTCARTTVAGVALLIARTGYTGEDGFELFVDNEHAVAIWQRLLDAGRSAGLEPCGLGARDVLRLEAGMPLYGHELDEQITPLQAGLGWAVKLDKPQFEGKAALAAQASRDDYPRIAGFIMDGRAPARAGYRVFLGERDVGEVRSGSPAPSLEGRNVGTALVPPDAAAPGTKIGVEIRGALAPATVTPLPFYKRKKIDH
ncbi:MAG: glycine cleavage system aminomethyltransferase GcvT [Candidatus Eremiobacteraeota bacterium]|nr:glycine cleavage system aminomethyltransferase GcvT [Candidatus Eremiobacteraeota bacterium]